MSELMDKLLSVSAAPNVPRAPRGESVRTAEFSLTEGTVTVPEDAPEGKALDFLEKADQNPDDWEVTGFRRIEYGNPDDPHISTRFTYKRREQVTEQDRELDVEEVLSWIDRHKPRETVHLPAVRDLAILAIGDLQLGKLENWDGSEEMAAANALDVLHQFVEDLRQRPAKSVLIVWLGDHGEGFVSQGGANTWRTRLTLTEQNRIMRRLMYEAVDLVAPEVGHLVMAAVPGNHGEAQRIAGKGVTRYDDNHDTEQLNAVAEGVRRGDHFDHVEFLVPQQDEVSLSVEIGGLVIGATHGNWWNSGKHEAWWEGQSFHDGPVAAADVLLAGHWHHLLVQDIGKKLYVQVPALEKHSQWWRVKRGVVGHPGAVILEGHDGKITNIRPLRAQGVAA